MPLMPADATKKNIKLTCDYFKDTVKEPLFANSCGRQG